MARIVALCGGVGGAKLAYGLAQILHPDELSIIVNTGDDFEHLGLVICPDLDTVLYTLGGVENKAQGWGRADETTNVLDEIARRGGERWFMLGDKDIALHLHRRQLRDQGHTLTAITRELALRFGIEHAIMPMSDDPVRTIVETDEGALAFQDYFVRRRCEPRVLGFRFEGDDLAEISPHALRALSDDELTGIILCPSNPFVSIGPILSLPGMRRMLSESAAPVLAVSPIVGGRALKGPAGKMMRELGFEVSALAVARHYAGLVNAVVLDETDQALAHEWREGDPEFLFAQTVMTGDEDRIALAEICLGLIEQLARG